MGLWEATRKWIEYPEHLLGGVVVFGSILVGLLALTRQGFRSPLGPAIALQLALVGSLAWVTMVLEWNGARTTAPLLALAIIARCCPVESHQPQHAPGETAECVFLLGQTESDAEARAVVSHGGSGTMLGALAHGAPLVLLPQGADQFDNAGLCRDAGVALVLPSDADAGSIRAALERVLGEPGFRARAGALAAEIAALPSAGEVAFAVETYAAAG